MTKIGEYIEQLKKEIEEKEKILKSNSESKSEKSPDLNWDSIRYKFAKLISYVSRPFTIAGKSGGYGPLSDIKYEDIIIANIVYQIKYNNYIANIAPYALYGKLDSIMYNTPKRILINLLSDVIFNNGIGYLTAEEFSSILNNEDFRKSLIEFFGEDFLNDFNKAFNINAFSQNITDNQILFYSITKYLVKSGESLSPEIQTKFLSEKAEIEEQMNNAFQSEYSKEEIIAALELKDNYVVQEAIFGSELLHKHFGRSLSQMQNELEVISKAISDILLSKKVDSMSDEDALELYLDLTDDLLAKESKERLEQALQDLRIEYESNPELQGFDWHYDPRYKDLSNQIAEIESSLNNSRAKRKNQISGSAKEILKDKLKIGTFGDLIPTKAEETIQGLNKSGITINNESIRDSIQTQRENLESDLDLLSESLFRFIRDRDYKFKQAELYRLNHNLVTDIPELIALEDVINKRQETINRYNELEQYNLSLVNEMNLITSAREEYDKLGFIAKKSKKGSALQEIIYRYSEIEATSQAVRQEMMELGKQKYAMEQAISAAIENFKNVYLKAIGYDSVASLISPLKFESESRFGFTTEEEKSLTYAKLIDLIKQKYQEEWDSNISKYNESIMKISQIIHQLKFFAERKSESEITAEDVICYTEERQRDLEAIEDLENYYFERDNLKEKLAPEAFDALMQAAKEETMGDEEFSEEIENRMRP